MSTRSTTHFTDSRNGRSYGDTPVVLPAQAIVYRHHDGYPEAMKPDLRTFFEVMRDAKGSHFMDAEYLASHWVVFLARMYTEMARSEFDKNEKPFDFSGIGVTQEDPGDIKWRYLVNCASMAPSGFPYVAVQMVGAETVHWEDPADWTLDPGTLDQVTR